MIKNFTKAVLGLLIAGTLPATAQQFQTALDVTGDEYINKVLIDNGNIVGVGSTNAAPSAGGYDLLFLSGNDEGTFIDEGQVGGTANETARAICKLSSGHTIIAGASNSFAPFLNLDDFLVINLDENGDPAWITVLGTDSVDRAFVVTEGNDGSIIIGGQTGRSVGNSVKSSGIVTKLDAADGSVVWSKRIGNDFINHVMYDIQAINEGGYLVVGFSGASIVGMNDALFMLLDEDGDKQLAFATGSLSDDNGKALVEGGEDKFYIAGNTNGIGAGGADAFVAKFDASAFPVITMDWFKTYGSVENESLSTAFENSANDGIILVGTTNINGGDAFAVSIDSDGDIVWAKTYGDAGYDIFQDGGEDGNGGFIFAGYSNSFLGTANDAWIVRTDVDGASLCYETVAAFAVETQTSPDAEAVFSDLDLDGIPVDDITLTARDITTLLAGGFNSNPITTNSLCSTVSVIENSAASLVSIYPNPANDVLNFNFGVNAADAKGVVIYNATGAKVYEVTFDATAAVHTANISNLSAGLYTAIVTMNNASVTAKISVAK